MVDSKKEEKMSKPTVSVIIPTYNRPQLLQKAIDSVLCQTFTDWELLIIDDHSDSLPQINIPDGENRIIPIRLPWNTGYLVRPTNVGIMCARGKIISYLNDDCVYLPDHLEVLYKALTETQADVVYGDRVYKSNDPNEKRFMGKMSYDYDLRKINQANYVDNSDIMHTIQAINDIGFWDIFWERKADWLLMVKFGKAGKKIVHVPKVITTYNWHNSNLGTPK